MGMKVGELYAVADVRDRQFNTKLGRMRKMLGNKGALVGAAVAGTAAIGAAFSAVAADGIKQFSNMEKQMSEVFTLLPNASSDAKDKMINDMQEFKMEMGTTTDETVPALYDAISAGVPEDNVFEFLETAQKAARGGVTDLNTAVDGLTTVINAYGKEISEAEDVSDILFTTVRTGKTTMDELGSSLSDVAPIAAAVGVNFEDVGAALATMTAQGVPTAQATTQLRQAMNELSKEGTNAYDVFKDVAGVAFTEFIEQGGNLQEAMVLMEQAAEDNNTQVQNLFQNIRGGQAALTLTGSGAETFAKNLDEMGERAGATDEAFQTMMDTTAAWQDRLTSAMDVVREKIGEQLQPYFQAFVEWAVQNMPKVIDAIEKIGPAIDGTVEHFDGLFKEFKFLKDIAVLSMKAVVNAFKGFGQSFEVVDAIMGAISASVESGMNYIQMKTYSSLKTMFYKISEMEMIPDIISDQAFKAAKKMSGMVSKTAMEYDSSQRKLQDSLDQWGEAGTMPEGTAEDFNQQFEQLLSSWEDVKGAYFGTQEETTEKTIEENNKKADSYMDLVEQFKEANEEISSVSGINTGGGSGGEETAKTSSGDSTQKETIFEDFVQESAEQGKKGGEAFAEQFNGNLNSIDLMTPTEEAMKAQTDYISKMNDKQLQSWIKQQNEKSRINRERHQEMVEFSKKWGQRLFEQNATEMEMLEKEREKAITEAERKGASTWAIEQYYANEIDKLEKKQHEESVERFKERFGFIKTGFKDAFESILQGTASVTDAFGNLWNSILDEVMSRLAQMAASKVFSFIVSGGSGGLLGGIGSFFGGIFHNGGVVPGPIGAERLILAQGGETVTPAGKSNGSGGGGYNAANIVLQLDGRTIAQASKQHLADTVRIGAGVSY